MGWEGQKCRAGCAPGDDCWYEQQFNKERGKLFGLWAVFLTEIQREDIWDSLDRLAHSARTAECPSAQALTALVEGHFNNPDRGSSA